MEYKTININNKKVKETIDVHGHKNLLLIGTESGEADIEIILREEDSSFNLYGILVGRNEDAFNVNVVSNHDTKNANSRVHIKTVLFDKAKFDFAGLIKIAPGAILSDAYLKNDNLVIGDDAVVNSSPQLEIKADDVKASHGVTISTISDVDQYYLRSRGLTDLQSKEILVEGFINEILQLSSSEIDVKSLVASKKL